jgi:hypothetical protein
MKSIDDPSGIDVNVYNAVLIIAKERGLISEEEFEEYNQSVDMPGEADMLEGLEAEKNKYWKCPACHQIVDMDYALCWNCQKEQPTIIEHPDTREVIEETKKISSFNPVRSGFGIIALGILVFLLDYFISFGNRHLHLHRLILAGILVLIGLIFVIAGLFHNENHDD